MLHISTRHPYAEMMHALTRTVVSILVGVTSLTRAEGPCPTITSMFDVCPSCCVMDCTVTDTITNPPDCPLRLATSSTYFPCGENTCPTGCVSTSYDIKSPGDPPPSDPCPTVMTTQGTCSTCIVPECVRVQTISFRTDCPWPAPTKTVDDKECFFPCPGGCARTDYVTVTPSFGCEVIYPRATTI
ncbi:uncharacterized protein TCAP_00703 [Tolypocladium capitatum]|uniref:Uncharacterized protein n=1 Tax=Tolypocladium capitatum TaxID=45235 RepID=A0A2K3QPD8_9HYPO|nr:uncharacterized protein TCAP_00703 [Tolypocladium capitatum]